MATQTPAPAVNPDHIMQIGLGFWASKTLLSAVELGVFTELARGPQMLDSLAEKLGVHPRSARDFFDTLVALRFLERDGDGEWARYRNTEETAAFLDRNSPRFMGGFLEMANDRLYPYWGELVEALKTGKPQNETKNGGDAIFSELYKDPAKLEQFMDAMAGISEGNFRALAEKVDFSAFRTLTDVGGATGLLSMCVAEKNPHIKCTTADLPQATTIAKRRIAEAGKADQVSAHDLDFFKDPIPAADVVTMGMILHDWSLEKKMMLIRKAYDALPEGGAFIVVENIIDDARRENGFGLMMSLNMLIEFGDAFDFTVETSTDGAGR